MSVVSHPREMTTNRATSSFLGQIPTPSSKLPSLARCMSVTQNCRATMRVTHIARRQDRSTRRNNV